MIGDRVIDGGVDGRNEITHLLQHSEVPSVAYTNADGLINKRCEL